MPPLSIEVHRLESTEKKDNKIKQFVKVAPGSRAPSVARCSRLAGRL